MGRASGADPGEKPIFRFACTAAALVASLAETGCSQTAPPIGNPQRDLDIREQGRFEKLERHTFSNAGADVDATVAPAPRGDPEKFYLYFASTWNAAEPDIYRKPMHGHVAIEQLTSHPAADRFPRPRPGNPNQIAFASNRRGNWDLWLLQLKTDGPPVEIQLTFDNGDEIDPTWDPTGQFLAYTSLGAVNRGWSIMKLQLAAKLNAVVAVDGFLPDWHPKDPLLVFQRARQRPPPELPWYSLWTISTAGNLPIQIVSDVNWAAIAPCWSPDGEWIAFTSVSKSELARRENRWLQGDDIWIVRSNGTQLTQLTFHEAPDSSPSWVADDTPGGRIYFTSARGGGTPNIWSVRPVLPAGENGK